MAVPFADDVTTQFHRDYHFGEISSRAAAAFGETITALIAGGKRALKVLEDSRYGYWLNRVYRRSDVIAVLTVTPQLHREIQLVRSHFRQSVRPLLFPGGARFDMYSFDIVACLHALHTVPDMNSPRSIPPNHCNCGSSPRMGPTGTLSLD